MTLSITWPDIIVLLWVSLVSPGGWHASCKTPGMLYSFTSAQARVDVKTKLVWQKPTWHCRVIFLQLKNKSKTNKQKTQEGKKKSLNLWGPENFQVDEHVVVLGGQWALRGHGNSVLLPILALCISSIWVFLSCILLCAKSLTVPMYWLCIWLWLYGLQPTKLLHPRDSPGKNADMGSHSLLQGIFLTQGWKLRLLGLLHWQMDSLPLAHLGI